MNLMIRIDKTGKIEQLLNFCHCRLQRLQSTPLLLPGRDQCSWVRPGSPWRNTTRESPWDSVSIVLLGLCIYCAQARHYISQCPLRPRGSWSMPSARAPVSETTSSLGSPPLTVSACQLLSLVLVGPLSFISCGVRVSLVKTSQSTYRLGVYS